VINALRQRERDGLVVLAPAPGLKRGDPVRITRGIFSDELALYDGVRPHERVGVLLCVLGRVFWTDSVGNGTYQGRLVAQLD
jgi:hypothetical protein